ncbi:PLP-dependent transferase [Anaeromyces robustus]|uniref:PLP-dependent transferase n=1 Tax=Anaeromyces robustus TaxID=1754192 RepID=A0A1Y1X379_9FUNG|nr:PLP-dependent transferase [Anaeromyces robustus]|eukprot:ORX80270.1 PLP-dependent transferase [Anaeromyces robustus]
MKFADRLDSFGAEIFAALNEKKLACEAKGQKIYNFSVGTPDFPVPQHIRDAVSEAAQDPENWKYSLRDMPELLQAVCDYFKKRYDVDGITPDMVMSCYGTQEGCGHLALTLLNKGDIILLPDPCYPVFQASALLAEANPYYYPLTKDNGFLPDVNSIPEDVAKKAKAIIVSLPANPVGSIAREGIYDEIIAWAKKYDVLVIHDNAYSDIIFDGNIGQSFLKVKGALDVGVEFFSLSKSFNVTGARISFLIGRKDVVSAVRKLRSQIDFGMFIPIQKAAIAALTGPDDSVKAQKMEYQARRDAICGGARKIGWNIPDAKGSMFVWAPVPEGHGTSMDFCMELLEKTGVLCTPGSSFGPSGEGYIRIALVSNVTVINEALKSIEDSGILK